MPLSYYFTAVLCSAIYSLCLWKLDKEDRMNFWAFSLALVAGIVCISLVLRLLVWGL